MTAVEAEDVGKRGENAAIVDASFDINPGKPLPEFNKDGVQAFEATARLGQQGRFVATITEPEFPLRIKALRALRGTNIPMLMKLEDWSISPWPPAGGERLICIFKRPDGDRLCDSTYEMLPVPDKLIMENFFKPAITCLTTLGQLGISHGSIRPDNIWHDGKGGFVFGECCSLPGGITQPELFEHPDRGRASPEARGEPSISEDIYSLAMSAVFLMAGRHPLQSVRPEATLAKRFIVGSFMTITEQRKMPQQLVELVRGMLQDDPRDRWSIMDIEGWFQGKPPKNKVHIPRTASWPLEFDGINHLNIKSMAAALGSYHNARQALDFVKSRKFKNWVNRGVDDERLWGELESILMDSRAEDPDKMPEVLTMICMALHAYAPLFINGQGYMPSGLGTALALNMEVKGRRESIRDLIKGSLPIKWLSNQPESDHYVSAHHLLGKSQALAARQGWGFGLERVVYEMQPAVRCQSPLLRDHMIFRADGLLPVLEELAQKMKGEMTMPLDRHIVSFILSRRKDISLGFIDGIDDEDRFKKSLAGLRFLVQVEEKAPAGPLPGLSEMFAKLLEPGLENILRPRRKKELQERLQTAINEGTLKDLEKVFEQHDLFDRDQREYQDAIFRYQLTGTQIQNHERESELIGERANLIGSRIAFFISLSLSSLISTGIAWFFLS